MSTLLNRRSISSEIAIAVPVALAAIGFAYSPARSFIALAIIAAVVMLFKPLAIAALRSALLIIAPRQSVAVAKTRKAYVEIPAQNSYALARKANQIAQSQPELAAELRLRAYYPQAIAARAVESKAIVQSSATAQSKYALNREANRIAQRQPELAAKLRMQAAYA